MIPSLVLPDWLPWWLSILLLVPALLYALLVLVIPFNVFGVKGRLDAIELRLDEIQGEIRSLALRLPERIGEPTIDDPPFVATRAPVRAAPAPPARPPIPPAPDPYRYPDASRPEPIAPRAGPRRSEPRFD